MSATHSGQAGGTEIAFTVPDMSCGHCVKAITEAVQGAIPGASVAADTGTKRVVVMGAADRDAIKTLIEEAGYTPEPA